MRKKVKRPYPIIENPEILLITRKALKFNFFRISRINTAKIVHQAIAPTETPTTKFTMSRDESVVLKTPAAVNAAMNNSTG